MTPEQQRKAIAEACGWEKIYKGPEPDNRWMSPSRCYSTDKDIPDYLNDLNAMHEAEKVLLAKCDNDPQDDLWIDYLANLLMAAPCCLREHATAAQRAEAFLKTLNLWTE